MIRIAALLGIGGAIAAAIGKQTPELRRYMKIRQM